MNLVLATFLGLASCGPAQRTAPRVEFTKLPPAGEGNPEELLPIEGRAFGAAPDQKIVLFARSGVWWVQPLADRPYTSLSADSNFKSQTHPGSAYAALLVKASYKPPPTMNKLPEVGGDILASVLADGPNLNRRPLKTIRFSGYDWQLREVPSSRGGSINHFEAANVTVDASGHLHLKIAKRDERWTSAELSLTRSLGYGSYRIRVRNTSHLEPAVVFSMFTWDDAGPSREMDIEISRWGEANRKNAQYVIQPYFVPSNVVRFTAPPGPAFHSFRWDPGRVTFESSTGSKVIDSHTFTSGVPLPGTELLHLNLYTFKNRTNPLLQPTEVVVESFEYLP